MTAASLFSAGGRSEALGRSIGLGLLTVLVLAGVGLENSNFVTAQNFAVMGLQIAFISIAAAGMALLMIGGQIDLSVGSTFALGAVVAAKLALVTDPFVAAAGGIAVGGLVGLVNGVITWRLKVSPIIVTLGSLTFVRGLVLLATGDRSVSGVPAEFTTVGQARILGVPLPVYVAALVLVVAGIVLSKTNLGMHIRAWGDNPQGAEVAGLNGTRLVVGLFVLSGLMAGSAGALAASRLGGASPNFGVGFELTVITAVILGGVGINGGEGSITGVALAVVALGTIESGIIALGLNPNIGRLITGAALVIAVGLDQLTQERRQSAQKRRAQKEYAEQAQDEARGVTPTIA